MKAFEFKCQATETLHGTAYFTVEAESEEEARKKLAADSSEYFIDFTESDGGTDWEAKKPEDWEAM